MAVKMEFGEYLALLWSNAENCCRMVKWGIAGIFHYDGSLIGK